MSGGYSNIFDGRDKVNHPPGDWGRTGAAEKEDCWFILKVFDIQMVNSLFVYETVG